MQPQADNTAQPRKTVLTVKHSMQGRWEVCDAAQEQKPLADFDSRDDALEYARGVASVHDHVLAVRPRPARELLDDGRWIAARMQHEPESPTRLERLHARNGRMPDGGRLGSPA